MALKSQMAFVVAVNSGGGVSALQDFIGQAKQNPMKAASIAVFASKVWVRRWPIRLLTSGPPVEILHWDQFAERVAA